MYVSQSLQTSFSCKRRKLRVSSSACHWKVKLLARPPTLPLTVWQRAKCVRIEQLISCCSCSLMSLVHPVSISQDYLVLLLALTNGCYNYLLLSFARLPYGMLRYQHSPCLSMACWLSRTFVTFYQCRLLDACMNLNPHTHPSLGSGERFMS